MAGMNRQNRSGLDEALFDAKIFEVKKYEPLWGAWHVDSLIGEGSFGKVYKVRRVEFGNTYHSAVKLITIPQNEADIRQIRGEGMSDASIKSYFHAFVADIIQEINLMSEFRGNSNIVSFEDHKVIEKSDGIGWDILIRMELLTSLTEHITKKPLAQDDVIKLGIHICRALELCAAHNAIHRDIKPDNIFVSKYGDYKLGDFGVARQIERTSSGMSKKGTYTYMAPEVFTGQEYGACVDIYSLGIVMYRFLNQNRTPFLPDFPSAITPKDRDNALNRRMKGEPLAPIKGIRTELNSVVLRACEFDRKKRFASPTEMREALEELLGGKSLATVEKAAPAMTPQAPQARASVHEKTEAMFTSSLNPIHSKSAHSTVRLHESKRTSETGDMFENYPRPDYDPSVILSKEQNGMANVSVYEEYDEYEKYDDYYDPEPFQSERESALMKSFVRKRVLEGIAFVALVLALIWGYNTFFRSPSVTRTPNLVGLSIADARDLARNYDFIILDGGSDYHSELPRNYVISQYPPPLVNLPPGGAIRVMFSLGPRAENAMPDVHGAEVTMPNVLGQLGADVADMFDEMDHMAFGVWLLQEYSDTVPAGHVISQDPPEGTLLRHGDNIVLTVSLGPVPTPLPEVVFRPVIPDDPGFLEHFIEPGQSLASIAQIYWPHNPDTPSGRIIRDQLVAHLVSTNRLSDPEHIFAGTWLIIYPHPQIEQIFD